MDYNIRECVEADLINLVVLCQKHAAYEQADYDPNGKAEQLRQGIFSANKKLYCLVVEAQGALIGYASYTFDYSTWDAATFLYLDCLYLDEDFRSYGIGQLLVDTLRQIAKTKNCVNMQWQTPDFNVRAIKFYDRIGGIGKNKVRYTLPLNS